MVQKNTKRKGKKKYVIVPKKKIYTVPQQYEYNMKGGYVFALLGIGTFLGTSLAGYTLYNMYKNSKDEDTNDIFSEFRFNPNKTTTTQEDSFIPSDNISLENTSSEKNNFTNVLKQTDKVYTINENPSSPSSPSSSPSSPIPLNVSL